LRVSRQLERILLDFRLTLIWDYPSIDSIHVASEGFTRRRR